VQDYLIRIKHYQITKTKSLKMQFQITIIVMVLMQIIASDLIGWNRTRNTAHKHMLVRNKIGNSAFLDQYRQFYQIQKLKCAVAKNIRKRSAEQSVKKPRQNQLKSDQFNRQKNFRKFHTHSVEISS